MSRKWSKSVHYSSGHSDRAPRVERRETKRLRRLNHPTFRTSPPVGAKLTKPVQALGVHTSAASPLSGRRLETPLKTSGEPPLVAAGEASAPTILLEKTRNTAAPGEGNSLGPTASVSDFRYPSATTGPGSGCRR